MRTKDERHAFLKRRIGGGAVRTQTQLLAALGKAGFEVDQSTLSRDLAELGVSKVAGRYQRLEAPAETAPGIEVARMVRRFVTCGTNLIVIHTVVGQAQAVGVFLDGAGETSLEATLAGDDTVLVAVRGRRQQTVALRRMETWFGEDKHVP